MGNSFELNLNKKFGGFLPFSKENITHSIIYKKEPLRKGRKNLVVNID